MVFDFERDCQDKDFVIFTRQRFCGVVYYRQDVLLLNLHVNRTCNNDEIQQRGRKIAVNVLQEFITKR